MAISPLTLLKSCFGVRPQPQAQAPASAARAARRVSIAEPANPRVPPPASRGRLNRFKSWVSRAFRAVVCCGFRRNPSDEPSSAHDHTPRSHDADSAYLASGSATPANTSPRTWSDQDSVRDRSQAGAIVTDTSETSTDADASDPFSISDSGYDVDSEEIADFESDREVDEPQGQRVELARQDLSGRDLREMDLRGANLEGAILEGVDLRGVDLTGANLKRANLKGAKLDGAILRKTELNSADLRGATLRDARISYSILRDSDLRNVDLRGVQYVWQTDFTGANLIGAQLERLGLLQNRCELAKVQLDYTGVQALSNEIDAISPVGLADARRLQRLLDDSTNGASILTAIDTAPLSAEDKVSLMEALLAKVGAAYRSGGSVEAVRFVAHFLNKHPFYAQRSVIIASFPKEPPTELERRSDSPMPSLHPRVRALTMSGSATRSESSRADASRSDASDSEKSTSSTTTRSRAGSLRDSVRSLLPGSSLLSAKPVAVPQTLPPRLDVGDPQTAKVLREALERGEDLRRIELVGRVGDHMAARHLLDVLVDIPPQGMPRINASIDDQDFDPQDDYRQGKTDEMWERTLTWTHLTELGIRIRSGD